MSVNINLADKRNPNQEKKEKVKKIKAISVLLLLLTAFLAVIIFVLDYRFSASYVQKQKADLLKSLEPYNETSAQLYIVNTKLADITKKIDNRNKYDEQLSLIIAEMSDEIEVEKFIFREERLELEISATDLAPLDDYLNYLIKLSEEKEIDKVLLNSMWFRERGKAYGVELTIHL